MAKTNDAVEIIKRRYLKNDPARQDLMREISLNAKVAQLIYTARKEAGLTQQQLADLIQTKQSVIARLEDADYEGHSLSMLQRISEALGQRIEINMLPQRDEERSPTDWWVIISVTGIVKAIASSYDRGSILSSKSEQQYALQKIDLPTDPSKYYQIFSKHNQN